jgi:hypothetical protein
MAIHPTISIPDLAKILGCNNRRLRHDLTLMAACMDLTLEDYVEPGLGKRNGFPVHSVNMQESYMLAANYSKPAQQALNQYWRQQSQPVSQPGGRTAGNTGGTNSYPSTRTQS